jgi:hypothetical protein
MPAHIFLVRESVQNHPDLPPSFPARSAHSLLRMYAHKDSYMRINDLTMTLARANM